MEAESKRFVIAGFFEFKDKNALSVTPIRRHSLRIRFARG